MFKHIFFILSILALLGKANSQCVPGSSPLPTVIVDSVSVLPNGDVIICWQASSAVDISAYDIIMFDPITLADITIATVLVGGSLCFIIPVGNANNSSSTSPREYGVRVRDLCANASINGNNYHNTMFLENTIDICAAAVNLSWNAYDDFNSGTNVLYKIFVSQDGAPFTLAGTSSTTTFSFTGVVQGSSYSFFVRAVENNGAGPFSSSSNIISLNANFFLKNPNFLYLYTASVVNNFQIDVQFYVDTAADTKNYVIKRKSNPTDAFVTIGSINATPGMNPLITFTDNNVIAKDNSYTYIVDMINQCDDLKITSNIGKTSLLFVINDRLELTDTIIWTPYEGWTNGVSNYEIYRAYGGIWETTPITTFPAQVGTMVYVDDVSDDLKGSGEFCYKVIAIENFGFRVGNLTKAKSSSNDDCVNHDPLIYIPNAFAPDSKFNPVFKPVLTFADPSSYRMIIYDRWGQKIFETEDSEEGWNGAKDNNGSLLPVGTYVYFVQFDSAGNQQYQYRGKVTLVQ